MQEKCIFSNFIKFQMSFEFYFLILLNQRVLGNVIQLMKKIGPCGPELIWHFGT